MLSNNIEKKSDFSKNRISQKFDEISRDNAISSSKNIAF